MIEVYNEDGLYDGTSVFLIEDIKNINWDDEDIRLIDILKNKKNTSSNTHYNQHKSKEVQ